MPASSRRDRTISGASMSRRRLLQGGTALAGGVAAASAGWGTVAAQEQRELRFWNLFGGGDGARLLEM